MVSQLDAKIKNKIILRAEVLAPKSINLPVGDFLKAVKNKKVLSVSRRAKLIIFDLAGKWWLLAHLKMTGQVVYRSPKVNYGAGHPNDSLVSKLPDKSTRVEMKLDGEAELCFNDQRKFGWLELVPTADHHLHKFISSLGPEPLEISFSDFEEESGLS